MTGKGLICELGKHQSIEGADRIVQVDMFGETVITQKTNKEGSLGILFDCETALSNTYASENNMFRHSELNKNKDVVGYIGDNGRIKAIKLKKVKCSGLWMPIESLDNLVDTSGLKVGQEIDKIENVEICKKYISSKTERVINKQGKVKENLTPTFKEHLDTDQWGRNKHKLKGGDLVTITEKLHGTSARCGYLPTIQKVSTWKAFFRFIANYFSEWKNTKNELNYNFVVGSRRVVKSIGGEEAENKEHFYDHDLWTTISEAVFKGKLRKGETVYFEIVGYDLNGGLIMGSHSNAKLKNFMTKEEYKAFINIYGETTEFTYNTLPNDEYNLENQVYVYRITSTNEDGDTIDYSWEQVKNRCAEMYVNHVPELATYIEDLHIVKEEYTYTERLVNTLTDDQSDNFPYHLKEGVCIRVDNGSMTPIILKNKAYIFKVLEGIIKDSDVVDIEESN